LKDEIKNNNFKKLPKWKKNNDQKNVNQIWQEKTRDYEIVKKLFLKMISNKINNNQKKEDQI
jgi:hypothetical protein